SRHVRSPRFVPTTRAPPTSTLFPYTTLFRSQPLGTARADSILAVARIRCHCAGDRVVEAEVEGLELVALDRRVLLDRELRDRLADVAVVMDDLGDGQADAKEVLAVQVRRLLDLAIVHLTFRFRDPQGVAKLVQEPWYPLHELDFGGPGELPRCHPGMGHRDDRCSIVEKEIVEHMNPGAPRADASAGCTSESRWRSGP